MRTWFQRFPCEQLMHGDENKPKHGSPADKHQGEGVPVLQADLLTNQARVPPGQTLIGQREWSCQTHDAVMSLHYKTCTPPGQLAHTCTGYE